MARVTDCLEEFVYATRAKRLRVSVEVWVRLLEEAGAVRVVAPAEMVHFCGVPIEPRYLTHYHARLG